MERRRILVIAGSDSSGGAGLEADQRVIAVHQCYATTATTALTAQNTTGVRGIHQIPADFVVSQVDAVIDDVGVDVVKIGMLASTQTVQAVAQSLRRHGSPQIVLDPVMVATSGAQLLPTEAVTALRNDFLPLATILTPNYSEACLLLQNAGMTVKPARNLEDLIDLAGHIQSLGSRFVLLKGGHLPLTAAGTISEREAENDTVVNILHDGQEAVLFSSNHIQSRNTHGTGCSLASAIACQMVLNPSGTMAQQIEAACRYVEGAIRAGRETRLGQGSGPINHFHIESAETSTVRVRTIDVAAAMARKNDQPS